MTEFKRVTVTVTGNEVCLYSSGLHVYITRLNAVQLLEMLMSEKRKGNLTADLKSILKSAKGNNNG